MTGTERNAILKQMGITRWMLRDAVSAAEVGDSVTEAESVDTASAAEVAAPAPTPADKPVPSMPPEHVAPQAANQGSLRPAPDADAKPVMPTPAGPPLTAINTLSALRAEVEQCTACKLTESRTRTVFGSGPEQSDWLFVGEAPGQQEDRQGKPFVGRAGSLLTQMLLALGQPREQVFIANALKCRPPGNRDPLPEELRSCEPFLLKQIELLKPKVMVALGRISAQALLNSDQPLGKLRGQVYRYGPDNIPLIVTYHPAYLLRKPADKAKVWEDLLLANRQLPG